MPGLAAEIAPPERCWTFDPHGVPLNVLEWGDPAARPIVLCHGMLDHARGFDLIAPLLATRYRVIAFDARGHGDSGWADAYFWPLDIADLVALLINLGGNVHLLGHSRGGGLAMDAAAAAGPGVVRQLVNIDGFGPPPEGFVPPGMAPDSRTPAERFTGWLDTRRATRAPITDPTSPAARTGFRTYPSIEELVRRRAAANPRLGGEWLRHFVQLGSRLTETGWVWKADPGVVRGFGPFRVEWVTRGWSHLSCPLLAVIGGEPDTWGPLPEKILAERLALVPEVERATIAGAGHFVHMERPVEMANLLLEWLDR